MAKTVTTTSNPLARILWDLATIAGELFGCAGIIMIFLGTAHGDDARIPAVGYWACVGLSAALVVSYRVLIAAEEMRKDF